MRRAGVAVRRALRSGLAASALLGSLLPAQEPVANPPSAAAVRLSFGVYSFKRPSEVYKQFQPVIRELRQRASESLGRPVRIDLQVSKTYEACLDAFVAGDIDFVRLGPASYVLARQREPKIQLVATEREDAERVGLIVVRATSPMRSLADLAGCRFAFGDDQSTIGRYLSQAELVKAGIRACNLQSFDYVGRHDIVYKAVEIGDYDAGALHRATFEVLRAKGKAAGAPELRVLHEFENRSKPWVARAGLPGDIVAALRASILSVADPDSLKALKAPGFAQIEDSAYDLIREGMKLSHEFDCKAPPGQKHDHPALEAPKPPQPRPEK